METTDSDFQEKVIEQSKEKLIIADFWADWCVPCNMLGPILEKLDQAFGDKLAVAKINVDNNPQKSNEYQINAIPAVKFFKDGEVIDEFTGLLPEDAIKEKIDKALE